MRILIVEDERRLAEALGQIMEEQRYQADLVYDGADGLDYGLTGQYDMIVLDVMLPKLDGFTVLRRLRAEGSTTPVMPCWESTLLSLPPKVSTTDVS